MLTLGYETFGLSMLVFPKQTLAAYCGLRLEADALDALLREHSPVQRPLQLPTVECNLPLLLTLPLQSGESSLAQTIQGTFTRRKLPRQRYVERLEALARQEEERFGQYIALIVERVRADLEQTRREVTAFIPRILLAHGFDAVAQAFGQLAAEIEHLVSERGPLAQLQAQIETKLTTQLQELERVKRRLRGTLNRLFRPLFAKRRSRALKLTQDITLLKLTLNLCRVLGREDPLFRDGITWLESQRGRLGAIQEGLRQRRRAIERKRHELESRDEVLLRAGRGVCLTDMLKARGHSLEDYYRRAALDPESLARHVAERVATEEPATVLASLREEAAQQGQRAVESLSLPGVLGQLSPRVRQEVLSTCATAAEVQLRIDQTAYVTRDIMPARTRVCVVPGGPDSPLAIWLREVVAETWEFVHRESDEEILFLITAHRILPEALIGHRLIKDAYEHFPRQEWVQVLCDSADVSSS